MKKSSGSRARQSVLKLNSKITIPKDRAYQNSKIKL